MKERYAIYHPAGFDIIGISVDSHKDRWPKAMDEEKLPWPQFALETSLEESKRLYHYGGIPFCVLIDPEGKIVDRNMLGTYLDRKLIEIYGVVPSEASGE